MMQILLQKSSSRFRFLICFFVTLGFFPVLVYAQMNPPLNLKTFSICFDEHQIFLDLQTETKPENFTIVIEKKKKGDAWEKVGSFSDTTNISGEYKIVNVGGLNNEGVNYYRVKQLDRDGVLLMSQEFTVGGMPKSFDLTFTKPNPFDKKTLITCQVPYGNKKKQGVVLTISNLLGQEISTLVNAELPPGYHIAFWDGNDNLGNQVVPGVYRCELHSGDVMKKVLITRF